MRRGISGLSIGGLAVEALILVFLVALVPQIWQAEARRARAAAEATPPPAFLDEDAPRYGQRYESPSPRRDRRESDFQGDWRYPDLSVEQEAIARQSYDDRTFRAEYANNSFEAGDSYESPPRIPRESRFIRDGHWRGRLPDDPWAR